MRKTLSWTLCVFIQNSQCGSTNFNGEGCQEPGCLSCHVSGSVATVSKLKTLPLLSNQSLWCFKCPGKGFFLYFSKQIDRNFEFQNICYFIFVLIFERCRKFISAKKRSLKKIRNFRNISSFRISDKPRENFFEGPRFIGGKNRNFFTKRFLKFLSKTP